jgi:thiamine biosynthesis lipoprotein
MVEIGGELKLKGLNAKNLPWRIAIEQPDDWQGSVHKAISLTDRGMATSGDYRNYFEQEGQRFSHTIDPMTGYPITHNLASVTVIAETTAKADAWATALNVLGPEKGMALANTEKLAVYMIVKNGDHFTDIYSEAFAVYK